MRGDERIRYGLRNYFILTKFTIGQVKLCKARSVISLVCQPKNFCFCKVLSFIALDKILLLSLNFINCFVYILLHENSTSTFGREHNKGEGNK